MALPASTRQCSPSTRVTRPCHTTSPTLFRALANRALGGDVADTLLLLVGRIFLAVALRARGYGVDMIKAICRWKTDASAVLYARLLQDEHAAAVDLAMDARITPTLIATTRRDCVLDNDHCVQRAGGAHDVRGNVTARAASPSGPPTRTAADSRVNSGSDNDSDGEADGVVVAGPRLQKVRCLCLCLYFCFCVDDDHE